MRQQAVDAGDSDVVDVLNIVAHQFGGDDCLFGYRDVAGSGGDDHDHALAAPLAITLEHDGASQGTILCAVCLVGQIAGQIFGRIVGQGGGDGGVLFFGGAGREHVASVEGEAAEDARYLAGRFARGEDHFW